MPINGQTTTSVKTDLTGLTTTEADFRSAIGNVADAVGGISTFGKGSQVFNSSGTFTVPADAQYIFIGVTGGGGGADWNSAAADGGNGGGAAGIFEVAAVGGAGATLTVTVGSGGTTNFNGSGGGASSVDTLVVANGGNSGIQYNSASGNSGNGVVDSSATIALTNQSNGLMGGGQSAVCQWIAGRAIVGGARGLSDGSGSGSNNNNGSSGNVFFGW